MYTLLAVMVDWVFSWYVFDKRGNLVLVSKFHFQNGPSELNEPNSNYSYLSLNGEKINMHVLFDHIEEVGRTSLGDYPIYEQHRVYMCSISHKHLKTMRGEVVRNAKEMHTHLPDMSFDELFAIGWCE